LSGYIFQAGILYPVIVVVSLLVFAVRADDDSTALKNWAYDPAQAEKWKESPIRLPGPPPASSRLLAVPLGPTDTLKLYLDPVSLSRLKDGVARMTLVVETASSARNVFYDGIRCESREYKTYAIGRPDGSWMLIKNPEWKSIPFYPSNAFRHFLMKHYVCSEISSARKPDEIVQVIRFPPPPID